MFNGTTGHLVSLNNLTVQYCFAVANSLCSVIVPYSSNPDFIGRTEILEKLKVQLGHTDGEHASKRTSQGRAGLYGLGGIGYGASAISS